MTYTRLCTYIPILDFRATIARDRGFGNPADVRGSIVTTGIVRGQASQS